MLNNVILDHALNYNSYIFALDYFPVIALNIAPDIVPLTNTYTLKLYSC